MDAAIVVGQPSWTVSAEDQFTNHVTSIGFYSAMNVAVSSGGNKMVVSDYQNNRVLIYLNIAAKIAAFPGTEIAADFVIGQPDFTSSSANNGGRSASSISEPQALAAVKAGAATKLLVVDRSNYRVLIYNIGGSGVELGPQFTQGKAVLGKVFWDPNSNGWQDGGETGIEGVKVVSDTGIYAITDEDGKYHYPYIETGQRVLKIDSATLPEGSTITTESPRKVVVTKGILTKVSFGVRPHHTDTRGQAPEVPVPFVDDEGGPLLKVSIGQEPVTLNPRLSISAELKEDQILFSIETNYFLLIKSATLTLYGENYEEIKSITLPEPLPLHYELPLTDLPGGLETLRYQLTVTDKEGREDRTGIGSVKLNRGNEA